METEDIFCYGLKYLRMKSCAAVYKLYEYSRVEWTKEEMMRITIENDELVYIYLMDVENRMGIVDETIPCITGALLYDDKGYWIGIRLSSPMEEFQHYAFVDEYEEKVSISISDEHIEILFDENQRTIAHTCEQEFNLDITGNIVHGIEIILDEGNSIKKNAIPEKMIESKM